MTTKTQATPAALKRRIRQFYRLLNSGDYERCHRMIDPRLRQKASSVTLWQYETALRQFIEQFGSVTVAEVSIELHLGEPSKLYEDRDFAVGRTTWQDESGTEHRFAERWVRDDDSWYTRSTGLVVPDGKSSPSASSGGPKGSSRKRLA